MITAAEYIVGFFTILWIVSWFVGIWIFHWQLFLTGIFAFALGYTFYEISKEEKKEEGNVIE